MASDLGLHCFFSPVCPKILRAKTVLQVLALEALITTTADCTLKYFFLFFRENKLDFSCELSA